MAYFEVCDLDSYFPIDRPEFSLYINRVVEIVERTTDRYLGTSYFDPVKKRFFLIWELQRTSKKENFEKANRNSAECATLSIICISKIVIKLRHFFDQMRQINSDYFMERYSHEQKYGSKDGRGSKCESKASILLKDLKDKKSNMWSKSNRFRISLHAGKIMKMFIGSHGNYNVDYKGVDLMKLQKLHEYSDEHIQADILMTKIVHHQLPECIKSYCRKVDERKVIDFHLGEYTILYYAIDFNPDHVRSEFYSEYLEE